MRELTIFEKAAAETLWRGLVDRNEMPIRLFCDLRDISETRRTIAEFVHGLPKDALNMIVLPDVTKHGRLDGGYSQRWALAALNIPQRIAKIDADCDAQKQCPALAPGLEDKRVSDTDTPREDPSESELALPD